MASTLEQMASDLADDTMKIISAGGDDRLHFAVADVLGASSQTLEEAYLTEVRVRMAGIAAKAFLKNKVKELKTGKEE